MNIDLVGIEGKRPKLHLAKSQYPALDQKGALSHPTPCGGVDAVSRRRAFSKDPVKSKQPGKLRHRPLRLAGFGRDDPRRIRIGQVQAERLYLQGVAIQLVGLSGNRSE